MKYDEFQKAMKALHAELDEQDSRALKMARRTEILTYVEFGFRCREKNMNLQATIDKANDLLEENN